jgi:hypothetical protein
MAVATITLESLSDGVVVDTVVVSAPNDDYFEDDIILDTDPDGVYDTGFTVRTKSGAFEPGGRIVGESVPIRELTLPFWLTPASRPRFQRLWGTPGNFRKVRWNYDGPSGLRSLTLRLAKEIKYTTEDGLDAAIDGVYHAVVSALAVNPNYEGAEDVAEWTNPQSSISVVVTAWDGIFTLTFDGRTTYGINHNASAATVQNALTALPNLAPGQVTVAGTPGNYTINFTVPGALTGSAANLIGSGLFHQGPTSVDINYSPNVAYFEIWNPTDQLLWPEWTFDPADEWQFPDFGFGQERRWGRGRAVGQDAARMIVSPRLTKKLSVMSDPFMDTYVSADLSNAAGLFNGVEPIYPVPPYTGTEDDPIIVPVVCKGPGGAKATLRQRRFWSAESGLEA